jgi:paraquat-inducible protein A
MSIVAVDPEASCPRCGERHRLPTRRAGRLHRCRRCGERIVGDAERRLARQRVMAFSLASLVLYPLAIGLPIMTLAQFGHARSTSVIGGVSTLWSEGHPILATVVAACSVVLPLGKCLAMLGLSLVPGDPRCSRRSRLVHLLEVSGRWGMLDVLLVAGLVAAVKLGELVRIEPGPGAIAFVACVVMAILGSAAMRTCEATCLRANPPSEPEGASA